jgi:transcriptional regulator with XRE-family HTH domain
MYYPDWLYRRLDKQDMSVAELERKTDEKAKELNEVQLKVRAEKLKELQNKKLKTEVYLQQRSAIYNLHPASKTKVSKATIFRILSGKSGVTPRKTTREMIEEVLGRFEFNIDDSVAKCIDSDFYGVVVDPFKQAQQKQNGICLTCTTPLTEKNTNEIELSLIANRDYKTGSDIFLLQNIKTETVVLSCHLCVDYFKKLANCAYADMIDMAFPLYEYKSQRIISEYLNTTQPMISKIKNNKVDVINEKLAFNLYRKTIDFLKSRDELNAALNPDSHSKTKWSKIKKTKHESEKNRANILNEYIKMLINDFSYLPNTIIENYKISLNDKFQISELSNHQSAHSSKSLKFNYDFIVRDNEGLISICCFYFEHDFEDSDEDAFVINKFLINATLIKANYLICLDKSSKPKIFKINYHPYLQIEEINSYELPMFFHQEDMFYSNGD